MLVAYIVTDLEIACTFPAAEGLQFPRIKTVLAKGSIHTLPLPSWTPSVCSGCVKMAAGKACEKQVLKVVWLWKPSPCSLGHSPPSCWVSPGPVYKHFHCICRLLRLCVEAVLKEGLHTSACAAGTIWQWLVCYYSLCRFILTLTDAFSVRQILRQACEFLSGNFPSLLHNKHRCKKLVWGFCSNFVFSIYSLCTLIADWF